MTARFFGESPGQDESGPSPAAGRFALIVGNDAYAGARLRNAGADAALIAETLRRLNFSVTLLQDATKPTLERAIVEFALALRRAGRKAVGLFYFAGHGVQEAGQNYLLPVDADIPDTAFLSTAAVSAQVLIDELAKAPAAAKVVILDACRSNPIPHATRATRDLRSGLAAIRDIPDGTLIVFSTAADSVAQDGRGANGPYATALAAFLTTPNRLLHEVMFDVSRHVSEATDGLQRPALFVQGAMPAVTLVTGPDAPGERGAGPARTDTDKPDPGRPDPGKPDPGKRGPGSPGPGEIRQWGRGPSLPAAAEAVMSAAAVGAATVIAVYLLVGTALLVTQRWASPCWPDRTTIHDRDTLRGNALQSFILPIFAWGPRFVEHVIGDDMPIGHFIFASDCQWSGQLPSRERLFARPADAGGCPPGTVEIRGQRCGIPPRAGDPVKTSRLPGQAARCPAGWVRGDSDIVALSCVLPSLPKPAGGACPQGFVAWSPGPDTDQVRTVDSRGTPFPPNTQLCRLPAD